MSEFSKKGPNIKGPCFSNSLREGIFIRQFPISKVPRTIYAVARTDQVKHIDGNDQVDNLCFGPWGCSEVAQDFT